MLLFKMLKIHRKKDRKSNEQGDLKWNFIKIEQRTY